MVTLSTPEAQLRLPELIAAAEAGETVEIRTSSGGTVRLAAQPAAAIRSTWPGFPHPGSAKGLIVVPDDFDEPLDELRGYEG
jgi:antitoxin (DNA-binding transcriptional repressor) of toxin-antitoxin stability system